MDARKRRRVVSRIIVAVLALGAIVLIGLGFRPTPVPVVTGEVVKSSLEVTVDESGKTRVKSRYMVSAPVLGNLARITLRAGDRVETGMVLARISPMTSGLLDQRSRNEATARVAMAQANVERAKVTISRADAALSYAREQANRQRALAAKQGTSQATLEQAEFSLRAAEEDLAAAQFAERVANHELAMARATVSSMTSGNSQQGPVLELASPIDGRVLRVITESEGVVQPGMALLELGDPRALEVVVDVLSTDAVRISTGAVARIERWGGDHPLEARVRSKEPSAFTTRSALGVEEQRVPVLLDLVEPYEKWSSLGDGYRVETSIRTRYLPQAVLAPAGAVFRSGKDFATYVVEGDKVKRVTFAAGERTPDWVEVKSGLSPGTRLVLYPSDQIKEGVLVEASHAAE
jgi:HlyD family secretion protein